MATIDKLALELEASGFNNFIKAMDEAEEGLKKVRKNMEKTAKENGFLDKELDRSSKKKRVKEKKTEEKKDKSAKLFNKNIDEGTKSLNKMLKTLMAISGISFGISGLISKSEQSAKAGTDLANQTRNINASPRDIEAVNTALVMSGMQQGLLDGFINKLSLNQSGNKSGRGGVEEILNLLTRLNGIGGGNIDYINTDPINTLKDIAKLLQGKDKDTRATLIRDSGLDGVLAQFLSNPKIFDYLNAGYAKAIQSKSRVNVAQERNAALMLSKKELDNKFTEVSEPFNNAQIAFNTLATTILEKLNPAFKEFADNLESALKVVNNYFNYDGKILTDDELKKGVNDFNSKSMLEKALTITASTLHIANDEKGKLQNPPWYNKGEIDLARSLAKWKELLKDLPQIQLEKIKQYDEMIESIDRQGGIIKFKNGDEYGGSWFDKFLSNFKYPTFMTKHFDELLELEPAEQLMQRAYSNQINTSNNQTFINEIHITTSASNIDTINSEAISKAKFIVGNPATLANFVGNTR